MSYICTYICYYSSWNRLCSVSRTQLLARPGHQRELEVCTQPPVRLHLQPCPQCLWKYDTWYIAKTRGTELTFLKICWVWNLKTHWDLSVSCFKLEFMIWFVNLGNMHLHRFKSCKNVIDLKSVNLVHCQRVQSHPTSSWKVLILTFSWPASATELVNLFLMTRLGHVSSLKLKLKLNWNYMKTTQKSKLHWNQNMT